MSTVSTCKAAVYHAGSYRASSCSKAAKRDGFCGTHHPDAVKARDEKARTQRDEKSAQWQRQMHAKTEVQRKASEYDSVVAERDAYRAALQAIVENGKRDGAYFTALKALENTNTIAAAKEQGVTP